MKHALPQEIEETKVRVSRGNELIARLRALLVHKQARGEPTAQVELQVREIQQIQRLQAEKLELLRSRLAATERQARELSRTARMRAKAAERRLD